MAEGTAYGLSDLLLFSPRVYYRLFELQNQALWPVQILTMFLGLAGMWLLVRPVRQGHRLLPAVLGGLWLWIAWAFFWERYAAINWAAAYVAPLFALQGLALLCVAVTRQGLERELSSSVPALAGLALTAFALVGYPWLAPLMGRSWLAAEMFGIAPDPTAVGTLAVLATTRGRFRWLLFSIPVLLCAISGLTLWTMAAGDFFVAPLAAVLAILTAAVSRASVFRSGTAYPTTASASISTSYSPMRPDTSTSELAGRTSPK